MQPETHLQSFTSSNIGRDMPMTPDSNNSRQGHLSVSESESGIEASMSSMGEEDDDILQRRSQAMTDQDPPLLQRAMRSAKRSAAQAHHKPIQGGFAKGTGDGSSSSMTASQQAQTSDLESLPREEQDMVMAGVANATMGADPVVMSTSSSSSIDSIQDTDQQQSQHDSMQSQPRNIPTPSSGYDGDSEGTTADTNRAPLLNRSMEHHHHYRHHHHHHPSSPLPTKHQMTD